jgi:hypothetical protein
MQNNTSEFSIDTAIHPDHTSKGERNLPYQPIPVDTLKTAPNWQVMAGHDKYKNVVRSIYEQYS